MKRIVLLMLVCALLSGCANKPRLAYKIDGDLPDIGAFYSGEVKRYFDESAAGEFVPRDDYGQIMPYVGSVREFVPSSDWDLGFGYSYSSYGFCTTDGRIVTEVNSKINSVRFADDRQGFGVYVVTEQLDVNESSDFADTKTLIIPQDGSWVVDLGANGGVNFLSDGLIFARSFLNGYEKSALVCIYDYDGNFIRAFDENTMFMNYSESLMLVMDKTQNNYFFLDRDGNAVLGPYDRSYPFNGDGYTFVKDGTGEMYIIDKEGERITDGKYYNIETVYGSGEEKSAFVCYRLDDKSKADIYSSKGEFILEIENESGIIENVLLFFTRNDDIIYTYSRWSSNWKCLSDGTSFVSKELGVCPSSVDSYGNGFYYFYKNDITKQGVLFDENGNTAVKSENMNYVLDASDDGRIVIYSDGGYENGVIHVYDTLSHKDIVSVDGSCGYAVLSETQSGRYVTVTEGDFTKIIDLDAQKNIFEAYGSITVTEADGKTFFNVVTNNTSTLYDSDKKVLLRLFIND